MTKFYQCGDFLHVYQAPSLICQCGKEGVPKGIVRGYPRRSHILTHLTTILFLMGTVMLIYIAAGGRV